MSERTEEAIITMSDFDVILGGETYKISPLVIRDSREWKKKVIDLIKPLPGMINKTVDTEHPEEFGDVLGQMMIEMPEQVLDLFFGYAKDLDREYIESVATDMEVAAAFEAVVKVAFPLASSAPKILGHLSQ